MKIRRFATSAVIASCFVGLLAGCGPDKTDKSWTEAPPPVSPTAHREMKSTKIRPPAPPSMGAPGGGGGPAAGK